MEDEFGTGMGRSIVGELIALIIILLRILFAMHLTNNHLFME